VLDQAHIAIINGLSKIKMKNEKELILKQIKANGINMICKNNSSDSSDGESSSSDEEEKSKGNDSGSDDSVKGKSDDDSHEELMEEDKVEGLSLVTDKQYHNGKYTG
jgi:hypothetical protein